MLVKVLRSDCTHIVCDCKKSKVAYQVGDIVEVVEIYYNDPEICYIHFKTLNKYGNYNGWIAQNFEPVKTLDKEILDLFLISERNSL